MPALFAGSVVWQIRGRTGLPRPQSEPRSPWKEMKCALAWAKPFPPSESEGWTVPFIERETRYWVDAYAGRKEATLFEQCTATVWTWASPAQFIRWFTVRVACRRLRGAAVWPGVMERGQRVPSDHRYPAVLSPSKSLALWVGGGDVDLWAWRSLKQRVPGATARRMG
jgi:hypothetical protein